MTKLTRCTDKNKQIAVNFLKHFEYLSIGYLEVIEPLTETDQMILNEAMVDALHAIRRIENARTGERLNVPANELGNRLIKLYYKTPNLPTRELVTEFMTEAGVVWLRKLLTRDVRPIASSQTRFASMNDYLGLLAANDSASDMLIAEGIENAS